MVAALADAHRSPLAALRAYAECMAGLATSPAAFARGLSYLQIDLMDPEFRTQLVRQARVTRVALERLVAAARRTGELAPAVNSRRLARTLEAVIAGSLFTWACYQQGRAARWIRADVDAVLAPYLPTRPNGRRKR